MRLHFFRAASLFSVLIALSLFAAGQHITPATRITQKIDPNQRTTLHGNVHPLARAQFDRGAAPDSMIADRMILILSRSDEQETALRQLLDDQQSAGSPNFQKWLTPEEFGQQFGPADSDVQTVTTWLLNNGFQVTDVAPGKTFIEFGGTAGQLRQAFHTDIHKYEVNGQERWANANDPQIPTALAPVIRGIASLNNFPRKPQARKFGPFKRNSQTGEVSPMATTGGTPPYYLLAPGDFAVIYGSNTAFQAGTNGTGQTIAIVGQTNINLQDVTDFRTLFGLPMTPDNHTSVIVNGPDPGINGDEIEAALDVEWAGASAPGANIVLVASDSTFTTAGVDLSALYIVQHNLAPVMSESYGGCEAFMGNAANAFYQQLWEQAAAQGITVVVSSGDNGSAGCDNPNTVDVATHGTAVSGIASTPFNVAVGGTDFNDATTQSTYFSTSNSSTYVSAKSYIPEIPWNDSCAGGTSPTTGSCTSSSNLQLWSGSGGPSSCSKVTSGTCSGTAKPSWQTGTGVPADGVRDVPDVSLFAATGESGSHSFYMMCQADRLGGLPSCVQQSDGYLYFVPAAGTSAGAPTFAGAIAMANQKAGHRLGNVNYLLYQIAAQSGMTCPTGSSTSSCVFHDITLGGNSVPCQGGTSKCSATSSSQTGVLAESGKLAYSSTTGYDLVTGLGSPNISNLVNKLANASFTTTTTSLTLNGATAAVSAAHGQSISVGVGVSPTASTGVVSLLGNHGSGDDLGIDSSTLVSGAANWNSTLFPGGTYKVHAHYPGDGSRGASDSTLPGIQVTISPEDSKTFVNLVTFDLTGHLKSYNATSAEYGSPYVMRIDVGDSTSTVSSTGFSSKCKSGTVSCPTGTLTVTANGSKLDGKDWPLNSEGFSEDDPIQLATGTYNIVANYPGDASYNASSANSTIAINKATTAVNLTPASSFYYQTRSVVTATVTTNSSGVAPGGAFTWLDNGVAADSQIFQISITPTAGTSKAPAGLVYQGWYQPTSLGDHTLTAQYSGDANYAASSGSLALTVAKALMNLGSYTVAPNVATPSLPVTIDIGLYSTTDAGTPTGSITFYDNGTALNDPVTQTPQGSYFSAKITHTFPQTGLHVLSATYSGDTYHASATQQLGTLTVSDKLQTTSGMNSYPSPALINYPTNLLMSVGIPYTYGLPTPTGTVVFSDNGQPLAGTVTYSTANFGPSPTLTATMPYSFTTSGTHNLGVSYSGDGTYASSSGSLTLSVVDKYTSMVQSLYTSNYLVASVPNLLSIGIGSSAGNSGPVMTGTVALKDGDTAITGTQTILNQKGFMSVQVPYTFTTTGSHNISVQYSGDDHYSASSQVYAEQVYAPMEIQLLGNDMVFAANGGGGSEPLGVYNRTDSSITVTLTCTPDSATATCSILPNPVTLGPNTNSVPLVNITVPALSASTHNSSPFRMPFVFAGVLAALSVIKGRKRAIAFTLVIMVVALTWISCGGGSGGGTTPPPPPPKQSAAYKFTITASDGVNTSTQTLNVTVKR